MEEEFVEIEVEDSSLYEDDEIDVNYEFDAPRFCDFTRPETFWDACEAEQWFEFAPSYPPSPFLVKFRWGNAGAMENVNVVGDNYVPCVEVEQVSTIEDNNSRGLEYCNNQTIQDTLDGKTKALGKSSSLNSKVFTFMKPTASHLAKLKNPPEVQTSRRVQEKNSLSIDCQLTKRQKLEAGYLRKVARLKHQTVFTHKKTKEVNHIDVNLASKPNVTVPREPNLQTALRAQRHKSRTNAESGEHTKSSSQVIIARPLNKKGGGTLNGNSISNSETSVGSRQEKCRMISKLRGNPVDKQVSSKGQRGVFRNIKVFPLEPNDKRFLDEPPTELLSKLCLASQAKQTTKLPSKEQPISKGLKENRPGTFHQEHEDEPCQRRNSETIWEAVSMCKWNGVPCNKADLYDGTWTLTENRVMVLLIGAL